MIHRSLCGAALVLAGLAGSSASAVSVSASGIAETDTAAIQAAVDASPNGTVTLNPGTFKLLRAISVANGASLIGSGSNRGSVVLSLATQTKEDGNQSVLNISSSANTVVSNMTLTAKDAKNGNTEFGPRSIVVMNSGLLVDCVVSDVKTKNGGYYGGGINLTGTAVVRGCTVTKCEAYNTGGSFGSGEAIYMTGGGLVENCVITGNAVSGNCGTSDSSSYGGTVFVGSGGVLRCCLVSDNVAHTGASGVLVEGGTVENCTIANNRQFTSSSNASGLRVRSSSSVVRNNIIWGNTAFDGSIYNVSFKDPTYVTRATMEYNDTLPILDGGLGNISDDPMFVDVAGGDYHTRYSYTVDAGVGQDWMTDARDMDGRVRIIGYGVDLGCYEREVSAGGEGRVRFASNGALDSASVTLTAEVSGVPADSGSWRFTRQQDGYIVNHSSMSNVSLPTGTWNVRATISDGMNSAVVEVVGVVDVRASRVYANANGRGEFPYDTVAKGHPSIDEAFPVVGVGGTLFIAEGSYVINQPLVIEERKGSRIESISGPDKTIIRLANCDNFLANGYFGLTLARDDAYVSGVTMVGGLVGPYYDGAAYASYGFVKMTAEGAVVTNCVFRDLKASKSGSGAGNEGVALHQTAGLIVDTLFARIEHYTAGGAVHYGGVMRMTGGVLDRARIEECWDISVANPGGAGDIIAVMQGAVMKNSLVTRCTTQHEVPVYAGVQAGSSPKNTPQGTIVNCTVVANTNLQVGASHKHEAGVFVDGGALVNCIVVNNWSYYGDAGTPRVFNIRLSERTLTGATYTLVDDRAGDADFLAADKHNINVTSLASIFHNPAKGDYSLATRSPAINVGLLEDWMKTSVDLAGRARVVSRIPDLGCYEACAPGFAIRLR